MEGVTVTNRMADGTICEDLNEYLNTHELPDTVVEVYYQAVLAHMRRMEQEKQEQQG